MNKNTIWGLVIIIVVLLGGYYYFNANKQNNYNQQTPTNTKEDKTIKDEITGITKEDTMKEEATKITVEGSEFKYNPSAISVKEGESVALTFKNVGRVPHNFVSDDLNVKTKTLNPGEEEIINFVAVKSGTFAFYCSIGNHRAQGMEGEVAVE